MRANDFFTTIIVIVAICLVFGIMIVTNAAKQRKNIDMLMVVLACIFTTPIGGYLYCLCFPPKNI